MENKKKIIKDLMHKKEREIIPYKKIKNIYVIRMWADSKEMAHNILDDGKRKIFRNKTITIRRGSNRNIGLYQIYYKIKS